MDKKFSGQVLVLGAGSVAQCSLPLILKHIANPSQVTVIDKDDRSDRIMNEIKQGVTFKKDLITQENLAEKLSAHVSTGDLLL
ncbi:MAG: saccharopine dehydrogenase NADP-binding domain-containing protein, partial [Actinomycetes bacterium]